MPLSPKDQDRLCDLAEEKCSALGVHVLDWFTLRGSDIALAYRLLVEPSGDGNVDAYSARTISPERMAKALLREVAANGIEPIAEHLRDEQPWVETVERAEEILAELLAIYDRGLRP